MRHHVGGPLHEEHKYSGRKITETSVIEFAMKRVDISREPVQVKLILTQIQGKNSMFATAKSPNNKSVFVVF